MDDRASLQPTAGSTLSAGVSGSRPRRLGGWSRLALARSWARRGVLVGRKLLLTGIILMGATPFAGVAQGQALSDRSGSVSEWRERTSLAQAWLDGQYADAWAQRVTYEGPPIVLRFSAHNPADTTVVRDVFTPAFEVLRRMSKGKLTVEATWDGKVHSLQGGWEALAQDRTDMTACYATGEVETRGFRLLTLLDLPDLFPNAAVATAVSERLYDRYFRADFKRNGVLIARMKATGPTPLFLREPVGRIADLEGRKIAAPEGIASRVLENLGAQPRVTPSPQIRSGLADKSLDGVAISEAAVQVYGLGGLARHELLVDLGRTNLEYCLSPSFYARLPVELRPVLNAWLRAEAQAESQAFYGRGGASARDAYQASGGQVHRLSPSQARLWDHRLDGIEAREVAKMERDGLPARQFMRDVRKLIRSYSKMSENDIMREAIDRPLDNLLP